MKPYLTESELSRNGQAVEGTVPAIRMTDCEILVVSLGASSEATKALAADLLRRFNCFDELLAACKALNQTYCEGTTVEELGQKWRELRAAIAKAEAT